MYYVLVLSFSSPREALTMRVYWWPKGFFVDGYERILTNSNLWLSYRNTIMYCATRAILTLATSVLAAYPLTVKHLYGRKFVTMFPAYPDVCKRRHNPRVHTDDQAGTVQLPAGADTARLVCDILYHTGQVVLPHHPRIAA